MSAPLVSGIDLVEIKRFREIAPAIRKRFITRVFTPGEQAEAGDRDESLAGKFAAKEAVAKALGVGIGKIKWSEVEILSDQSGQPHLILTGSAARIAEEQNLSTWSISITHTAELAAAVAVALAKE